MLIEHRTYTLRPGTLQAFWQAQNDRGYELVRPILERLIGYFFSESGPDNQVVHLYRYDDYADWTARLHGLYGVVELEPYFKTVRALMVAQENKFLIPAPVAALTPHWGNGNDWFSNTGGFIDYTNEAAPVVEETTTVLLPGSQPAYWRAYSNHGLAAAQLSTKYLLGCFVSVVGRLHQVIHYRCYPDYASRDVHRKDLVSNRHWLNFTEQTASLTTASETKLLRPSEICQLSPMFAMHAQTSIT